MCTAWQPWVFHSVNEICYGRNWFCKSHRRPSYIHRQYVRLYVHSLQVKLSADTLSFTFANNPFLSPDSIKLEAIAHRYCELAEPIIQFYQPQISLYIYRNSKDFQTERVLVVISESAQILKPLIYILHWFLLHLL